MVYCITVKMKEERRIVAVFSGELEAMLWAGRMDVAQQGANWVVRAPSMASFFPKKIARWMFTSKEEAQAFLKTVKVEEKRKWEAWLH